MTQSYTLDQIIEDMGETGVQVTELGAAEGSAGNISVFVKQLEGVNNRFPLQGEMDLPAKVSALVDGWVVITATGRRLRDVSKKPEATLCLLKIIGDGTRAQIYAAPSLRPTSEYNSHLAIQDDQVARFGWEYHAVLHAQPLYMTYLSHLENKYPDTQSLNYRLLRWEPETAYVFQAGIGMLPFQIPGSPELMDATVAGLREHRAVVWQRHGMVSRSENNVIQTADLIEYAETVAHYEFLNLLMGEPTIGISDDQFHNFCTRLGIKQKFI